ncbi:MAG: hypothetical protein IAE87_12565 [Rhodobacteraceae bacterium]|jgi:hypothetical protein|nr:hypothetical protein [Paracoccaceae bacterium]
MPRLIRLYILSIAIGFALSALFVGIVIWQDVAGLGRLILASGVGWIAALMMLMFFGILFSGVQFAIRIMMMAGGDDGPRGGLRQHVFHMPARAAAPAPAPTAAAKPGAVRPRR